MEYHLRTMKITKEIVEHIANLANLEFNEKEKEIMTRQLNSILEYMELLNKVDTSDVQPYIPKIERRKIFREDEPKSGLEHEKAMENSPEESLGYFKVPKVIS